MKITGFLKSMQVIGFLTVVIGSGVIIPLAVTGVQKLAFMFFAFSKLKTLDEIVIYNRTADRMNSEFIPKLNDYWEQQGYKFTDAQYDYIYKAIFSRAYEEEQEKFYAEIKH